MRSEPENMHANHVIIRGHVFTYAEKAPFMPSGKSVLGALEYEESSDQTKCHECGEFVRFLSKHIKYAHQVSHVDYNQRHGLRKKTVLIGPKTRRAIKEKAAATKKANGTAGCAANRANRANRAATFSPDSHNEARNERNRCTAQLIYRIQVTAAKIGRTPSLSDLKRAGIPDMLIERRFGSLTRAMLAAGLNPNVIGSVPKGGDRRKELPNGFPTLAEIKKRRNEPMPYPADYFDAAAIYLERKNG